MKAVWNNVEKHLSRIGFQKVQASELKSLGGQIHIIRV